MQHSIHHFFCLGTYVSTIFVSTEIVLSLSYETSLAYSRNFIPDRWM